jgi:hypothetical protein
LPIIRITKAQIEKANKARAAALLKNPEYRLYDERQQLRRQSSLEAVAADGRRQDAPPASSAKPGYRPCDESPRAPREGAAREKERES